MNSKKTVAIYGTGSSADDLLKEFTEDFNLICYYETNPQKKLHNNLPVLSYDEIDKTIDETFIASIYYPEIIESLLKKNIPLEKFTVAVAHLDDPRYGPIRIPAIDVAAELDKYIEFRTTINNVNNIINEQKPFEFVNRLDHLTFAYSHAPLGATVVEFGVYRGESLLHLSKLSKLPVWGFDSFSGFSEGSPWIDDQNMHRVEVVLPKELVNYNFLVKGYFEDTLVSWIHDNDINKIGFVHYDAGHYEATKFVLNNIEEYLIPGSVIVFDELIPSQSELQASEFDALYECYRGKFKIFSRCGTSVAIIYEG